MAELLAVDGRLEMVRHVEWGHIQAGKAFPGTSTDNLP